MADLANNTLIAAANSGGVVVDLTRREHYASCKPAFANFEMLVGSWREKTETIVNRPKASLPLAQLVTLRNATVYQNGFVYSEAGNVVQESVLGSKEPTLPDLTKARFEPGAVMLLRKPGDSNFGHWLVELLPRVREFFTMFPDKPLRFAVAAHPTALRGLRQLSLEWMGVTREQIIWINADPITFEEVTFITSNSIHSHTHDADGLLDIAQRFRSRVSHGPATRRLYVARGATHRRRLINESEIQAILTENGFEIVFPETLSLDGQIALFAEAEICIGVSGAALTNILWMPTETEIISLNPNYGHEFFFWDLACINNQRFSFVFGQSADASDGVHSDFSVDPTVLQFALTASLNRLSKLHRRTTSVVG